MGRRLPFGNIDNFNRKETIVMIFGTFAWSYPITLNSTENFGPKYRGHKNLEKFANIFGHFAKIAIRNLKNFKINENFKGKD